MTQRRRPSALAVTSLVCVSAAVSAPPDLIAQDTTAALVVSVTDHESGDPVPGATVVVDNGAYRAVANVNGFARVAGIRPGSHSVTVDAFGFSSERFSAHFAAGATVEAEVALLVTPIELDPIHVEAVATERRLRLDGFYERQKTGFGTTIPPEEVEQMAQRGARLIDAFRGVPGLRVIPQGATDYAVVSSRGPTTLTDRYCSPQIYLDGVRQSLSPSDLRSLPLTTVAAIEVYPSSAYVPPQYFGSGQCGAILIWTK